MSKLNTGLGIALALCAVLAMGSVATAGTTGKVMGTVMDEKGQPLPGASVVLEGTQRGATTDADGFYVVVSVDPDVYKATASMVGYHPITQDEVAVRADFTTTLNFRLREQELELEEMVVTAERPPVEPDKTESRYHVTAQEIQQTPILKNVTEFITLEAGIASDGTMASRGWLQTHNTVYVDGIQVQARDGRGIGGGWALAGESQWWGVNVKAVQEISVITGGANAEYGNSNAAVIQLVTRDGGSVYHGEVEYRLTPAGKKHWGANVYEAPELRGNAKWNDPEWVSEVDPQTGKLVHQRTNYTDVRGHYYDGFLSGPLLSDASFFVSARHLRDAAVLPGTWETRPANIRTSSKLTVPAGQNVKLRFGWIYDWSKNFNNGSMSRYGFGQIIRGTGRNLFIPAGSVAGEETRLDNMVYGIFTHTISPKTFYEVRLGYYQSKLDTSNVGTVSTAARTDKEGYFYIGREDVWAFKTGEQKRFTVKGDLSSQVTKGHFAKTGFEFVSFENWWTWTGMTPGDAKRDIRYIGQPEPGTPVTPKQFAFYVQDKMEFEGLVVNAGIRYDRMWGQEMQLLPSFTSGWYNQMNRFIDAPTAPMRVISGWGPKLGVSHPITENSSLHFSYGRYRMLPSFRRMFTSHWETASGPEGIPGVRWSHFNAKDESYSMNAVSKVYDKGHEENSFEVGADWNFVADYVVSLAAFYNSGNFQPGTGWHDAVDPVTGRTGGIGGTYAANRVEDTRGFEFSLRKSFSNYFSFRAALNIEWLDAAHWLGDFKSQSFILVYPDSNFIASGKYHYQWEVQGGREVPVPLTDAEIREIGAKANDNLRKVRANPNAFNARGGEAEILPAWEAPGLPEGAADYLQDIWYQHMWIGVSPFTRGRSGQGSMQVFVATPQDFGPGAMFGGSKLLGGVRFNMIYRIYTGAKWNYLNVEGKSKPGRGPLHTETDLNVQKQVSFGGLNADIFLEVFNLFNQGDTTARGSDYMWWGLQRPRPDDPTYLEYGDTSDRSRFIGNPRTSHMGIRLRF